MTGLTFKLNAVNGAERTYLGYDSITVRERVLSHTHQQQIHPDDHEPSPPGLAVPEVERVTYYYVLHCLGVSGDQTDHCAISEEDLQTEYTDGIYTLVVE